MNPYRAVRKLLKGVGYTFAALIALGVCVMFTAAMWPYFGAWSLTWPIVIPAGIVLASLIFGLVAMPFEKLARWWRRREREWSTR